MMRRFYARRIATLPLLSKFKPPLASLLKQPLLRIPIKFKLKYLVGFGASKPAFCRALDVAVSEQIGLDHVLDRALVLA